VGFDLGFPDGLMGSDHVHGLIFGDTFDLITTIMHSSSLSPSFASGETAVSVYVGL
jgi:hypothetical protein